MEYGAHAAEKLIPMLVAQARAKATDMYNAIWDLISLLILPLVTEVYRVAARSIERRTTPEGRSKKAGYEWQS